MTSLHDRHINPLILKDLNGENWHLEDYVKRGGYSALRRILEGPQRRDAAVGVDDEAAARPAGARPHDAGVVCVVV